MQVSAPNRTWTMWVLQYVKGLFEANMLLQHHTTLMILDNVCWSWSLLKIFIQHGSVWTGNMSYHFLARSGLTHNLYAFVGHWWSLPREMSSWAVCWKVILLFLAGRNQHGASTVADSRSGIEQSHKWSPYGGAVSHEHGVERWAVWRRRIRRYVYSHFSFEPLKVESFLGLKYCTFQLSIFPVHSVTLCLLCILRNLRGRPWRMFQIWQCCECWNSETHTWIWTAGMWQGTAQFFTRHPL